MLPRGRHALSREVVRASQRERLLEAMAEVTAQKGYHAVTIADIVQRAGTARRTFYEHFADKEECFLASFSRVAGALLDTIVERFDPALDQSARAAIVMGAFLDFLAANPVFARIYFVEVYTISEAGLAASREVRRRIAAMLVALRQDVRRGDPEAPPLTELHAQAVVGAVHEIVDQALHERGPERLPELSDELLPLAVALLEMPPPRASQAVRKRGRGR